MKKSELNEAVYTLLELSAMDQKPLYLKVMNKIKKKQRLRKRIAFVQLVAAVLLPFILYFSLSIYKNQNTEISIEPVSLLLDDGSSIEVDTAEVISFHGVTLENKNKVLRLDYSTIKTTPNTPHIHTLYVPAGNEYGIELEDGTMVFLNADSHLKFPQKFNEFERRVYVEGEAYYIVSKEQDRPFIVESAMQTITVLGTEFNINTHNDSTTFTTLVSGSIRVENILTGGTQTLAPGQQLILSSEKSTIYTADLSDALAWRNGIISMENKTLEEVIAYLSILYNVDFEFTKDEMRSILYRGSVNKSESIDEVLISIGEASPIRFERMGKRIKIFDKK